MPHRAVPTGRSDLDPMRDAQGTSHSSIGRAEQLEVLHEQGW